MRGIVRSLSRNEQGSGVKKPNESQKARALWRMKAARDSGEEFYDPERKDNSLGRNETRLEPWEEHVKNPIVALDKAFKWVEHPY